MAPAPHAQRRLLAASGRPYLTIGPWTHGSIGLFGAALREGWPGCATTWPATAGACGGRIHLGGAGGGWRNLPDWPPLAVTTARHLQPDRRLAAAPPRPSTPDRFWYDPADPTPSPGGPLLVTQRAGPVDNRPVEARPDVLTYTSEPLRAAVEVVGPVTAQVYVRSTLPYLDVFLRLCDVDRRGRSWNICDGLVRVAPGRFPVDGDGVVKVPLALWPAAHRFARRHRLRLQVSGARIRAMPATRAPGSRSARRSPCAPVTGRSCTTRRTRRRCSCR